MNVEGVRGLEVILAWGNLVYPLLCCTPPKLPLPCREQEQTSSTKSDSLTDTHAHTHKYQATKAHLRSRLASFQSRSINLKIWRVNMSCLRSAEREQVRKRYVLKKFFKCALKSKILLNKWKVISIPYHHDLNVQLLSSLPTSFLFHLTPPFPRSLIPPTISILEDDSQCVSPQQLVVVNNPEWLHLRVHVPTLLYTDNMSKKRQ